MQSLKDAGLKTTIPRRKILEIFEKSGKRHLSAEEVYNLLSTTGEDISLGTVYRVLGQFAQAGLLARHHFDDRSVFELDFGDHHDHAVCVKCGHVEEFCDPIIEQHQQEIAKKLGYTMLDHALHIYGLCPECT